MATPSAKAHHPSPAGESAGHGAHVEHLSAAPILVGLGIFLLYVGFEFTFFFGFPLFPLLGLLVWGAAMGLWIKEDVKHWIDRFEMPGVSPGRPLEWWGLLLFLGTEVMLFGGLFAVYFIGRAAHGDVWAEGRTHLPLVATAINTAILVASSFTLHFGEASLKKGHRKGLLVWLGVTIALGLVFLGLQVMEYVHLFGAGNVMSKNGFWSIFYQLTGIHGAHVLLGLIMLSVAFYRAAIGTQDRERHIGLNVFGIYWHFVDVVWIFLFLTIYVGVF